MENLEGSGTKNEWNEITVEDIKAPSPNSLATGSFGSKISSRYFQEFGVPLIRGSNLRAEFAESAKLEAEIKENLRGIGYGKL